MTSNHPDTEYTLVTGGTGVTGRRVVQRLKANGRAVRVGSRSGNPPFDWDDEHTWAPALEGMTAAYLVYPTDLGLRGAADRIGAFAGMAVEHGVRRLVLLAGRGQHSHDAAELAIRESGADWTILRASWLAQNFSEGFLADMVRDGALALPAGDAVVPFVDAEDVADVAATALTDEGHAGKVYELTGPRSLTFAAAADEIANASGRTVRYVAITPHEFATAMADAGLPDDLVEALAEVFSELDDDHNAATVDGVRHALRRPPRDFADFARTAAATGAWAPE